MFAVLLLLVLGSGFAGLQQAAPAGAAACPDSVASTGKYENDSFHFTVVIPKGFKGFWNSARCVSFPGGCTCMLDHGRIIPLGADPSEAERHVELFAAHAADPDDTSVQQAVNNRLDSIRQRSRAGSVNVLKQSNRALAGLKAQRVAVRYFDKQLNAWMVEDFVQALGSRGDEYSLYLRTREQKYGEDLRLFDSIVDSFRLTKLD